ncbi:MAG: cobyrinate a,c-diamide synthase [Desulfobacteraceae bacterium]
MRDSPPRIMIAALKGGSGKTVVSLGLARAWKDMGLAIAPFKKGPDFIDPGWLGLAAGRPCHNLDSFMMSPDSMVFSFLSHTRSADLGLIEANRGIFDGLDMEGGCSSAELAHLLKTPVILIIDVSMTTRTVAALVKGCQVFDPDMDLRGVILNRVGGERQEKLIRGAVEHYCATPVIGSIKRLPRSPFPERHMGLFPHREQEKGEEAVAWAGELIRNSLDLDALWEIGGTAPTLQLEARLKRPALRVGSSGREALRPRIGVIRDKAFWFYYPENLTALEELGAELVEINALSDPAMPEVDALYIGGGFPETQAEALAQNQGFLEDLRRLIEEGLPVYAECGGLVYLGEALVVGGSAYPMTGALPVRFVLEKKPQGHGYTILEAVGKNPYYEKGTVLRGHEFHYSRPVFTGPGEPVEPVFKVRRGRGLNGEWDGLTRKNVLAVYTHVHAAGTPFWAEHLVEKALEFLVCNGGRDRIAVEKGD